MGHLSMIVPTADCPRTRIARAARFFAGHPGLGSTYGNGVQHPEAWTALETSGTTGERKVVLHGPQTLLDNARAFNRHMGFTPDLRWYHCFSLQYTAGLLNCLLCPRMAGATVVLGPTFEHTALHFWRNVMEYEADALWLSPAMCEALLQVDRDEKGRQYVRDHVRYICVGTDKLKPETREAWHVRYLTPLLPSYGLSELLIVSATPPDDTAHPDSAGTPLPGVNVVEDDGELLVESPYAMLGYWRDGDVWMPWRQFPTGDAGELRDGYLYVGGRL